MQKYLVYVLSVLIFILLASCQSNQSTSQIYRPMVPSFTPSMNLAQTVQEAFMRSEDPAIAGVHVQTRNDVVILTGYVKKIRQSDIAEQIARQVPGVRSVQNNIIIRP